MNDQKNKLVNRYPTGVSVDLDDIDGDVIDIILVTDLTTKDTELVIKFLQSNGNHISRRLTREHVQELIPYLETFVRYGIFNR